MFDFPNVYEKVSGEFLFMALEKMGMTRYFIGKLTLLFQNDEMTICPNDNLTKAFQIERGVR
jgi:hypothetical protein